MKRPVKKRARKPPPLTMDRALCRMDTGRLASIKAQLDRVDAGQKELVSIMSSIAQSEQRYFLDCQSALRDLLHRIITLEKMK